MMFSSTPTISTMHEFFKTAVSNTTTSSRYQSNQNDDIHCHSRNDSESKSFMDHDSHFMTTSKNHHLSKHTSIHHNHNNNNNNTTTNGVSSTSTASTSLLPGTMNLFLPHPQEYNKYGIGGGSTGKKNIHHGMSENDIKSIVYNTDSFRIIQEQLRVKYRAQSNSVAKQVGIQLIREQYIRQQQLQLRKEQQSRQEQRQLQIAKELTEARIKSQQALKLKVKTRNDSDSDDDEGSHSSRRHRHEDDMTDNHKNINSTTSSGSPTSIMSPCVSIPDGVIATNDAFMVTPLMSMNDDDDDSEDGDIQEVTE